MQAACEKIVKKRRNGKFAADFFPEMANTSFPEVSGRIVRRRPPPKRNESFVSRFYLADFPGFPFGENRHETAAAVCEPLCLENPFCRRSETEGPA